MNDEWIKKPTKIKDHVDPKDVFRKVEAFLTEIERAEKDLKESKGEKAEQIYKRLTKIKDKLMKARKEGLNQEGELSIENLVFKKLRNKGAIEKLIDLTSQSYGKIYKI